MKFTAKHKDFDKVLEVVCIELNRKYITVKFGDPDILKWICDNDLGTIPLTDVDLFLDGVKIK